MLEMKKCCKVPFPERLSEGYEVCDGKIIANVNSSKILNMMNLFIDEHNESLFFILEIPVKCEDADLTSERVIHHNGLGEEVYFIDGLDNKNAKSCLSALGKFLVTDGMNTFGFGGHTSHEEILFSKYNITTIYTHNPEKYSSFFESFGIEKVDSLITAWQTFDKEHYGECSLHTTKESNKTIYDIPELYKDYGMYLYEVRKPYDEDFEREITIDELVGKVILVGITYYTKDNEFVEQKQLYGTVVEANEKHIRFKQKDGSLFTLPRDPSSTHRAHPGRYTLRSTGEVVVDPDFTAEWNVTMP